MTIRLKEGVKAAGLRPEAMLAIIVALSVYQEFGYELVITSLVDGKHSRGSLHYSGAGIDTRTRHMVDAHKKQVADEIQVRLGPDFDVVLEKDHIHIEFQPKG